LSVRMFLRLSLCLGEAKSMHQPGKWWVGLLPIAALWVLANGVRTESVEADVASRAQAVLAEAPDIASSMTAKASGRDVRLEGLEFADGDGNRMGQAVDRANGVRLVDWRLQRVLPARPFEFAATRVGDELRLTGSVPTPALRGRLVAMAKDTAGGKSVVDALAYATGAPNGFEAIVAYGLGEAAKLDGGSFGIVDTGYSISGAAASFEVFDSAIAGTRSLPDGLVLARANILPPEIKPYRWEASSDGKSVTLQGLAPSDAIRAEIAGTATKLFSGRDIVNRMRLARGAPNGDFARAATSALTELAKLADGETTITDAELSIRGHGSATATNDVVNASVRASLPEPFKIGVIDIIAPYAFKIAKGGGRVVLTGYAPNNAARNDLATAAKAVFLGEPIENQLADRSDAPARFVDALKALFPSLARLASGSLSADDTVFNVDGLAIYDKAAEQIKLELGSALMRGFKLGAVNIGVRPPPPALAVNECQPEFTGLLGKGRILFETGSAELSKQSLALLDHLIEVVQRCREASIEVAGHTDSQGSPESNLDLSRRRAEAVTAYIGEAGVGTSRITSAGYGETNPVASNDTPEGRAQNRRIEFVVK
jgi:OmpA-OmpF porin, OOP family